jgi:hypothetical protein
VQETKQGAGLILQALRNILVVVGSSGSVQPKSCHQVVLDAIKKYFQGEAARIRPEAPSRVKHNQPVEALAENLPSARRALFQQLFDKTLVRPVTKHVAPLQVLAQMNIMFLTAAGADYLNYLYLFLFGFTEKLPHTFARGRLNNMEQVDVLTDLNLVSSLKSGSGRNLMVIDECPVASLKVLNEEFPLKAADDGVLPANRRHVDDDLAVRIAAHDDLFTLQGNHNPLVEPFDDFQGRDGHGNLPSAFSAS